MADPKSKGYLDQALAATLFEVFPLPLPMGGASNPFLALATSFGGNSTASKLVYRKQYQQLSQPAHTDSAVPFDAPLDMAWFRKLEHKEAAQEAAAFIGRAYLSSQDGIGALALAKSWEKPTVTDEMARIEAAESKRRIPIYASLLLPSPMPSPYGFDTVFPYHYMNAVANILEVDHYGEGADKIPRRKVSDLRESMERMLGKPATKEEMAAKIGVTVEEYEKLPADADIAKYWHVPLDLVSASLFRQPSATIEALQGEMQEMTAKRMAESWAQANFLAAELELRKAKDDAAKYRRNSRPWCRN